MLKLIVPDSPETVRDQLAYFFFRYIYNTSVLSYANNYLTSNIHTPPSITMADLSLVLNPEETRALEEEQVFLSGPSNGKRKISAAFLSK